MSGDRFDKLFDALKADGAISETRENFKKTMYASGKQGYLNRKQLFDDLHAAGAIQSKSYEEFAQWLGLHAVQKTKQPARQTTAQKAMQMGGSKPKQAGQPARNNRANASEFVQGLYRADETKQGISGKMDYLGNTVANVAEANRTIDNDETAKAAKTVVNKETMRRNKPSVETGNEKTDTYLIKSQGQLEDQIDAAANELVANSGDVINGVIEQKRQEGSAKAQKELQPYLDNPYMDAAIGGFSNSAIINRYESPEVLMENIQKGIVANVEALRPAAEKQAQSLGISTDAYLKQIILPKMIDRALGDFQKSELAKSMPKNGFEYFVREMTSSNTLGKIGALLLKTKGQRQIDEEAMARTNAGENANYKPSTATTVTADIAGMVTDPVFAKSAKIGGAVAGKVVGNSTKMAALMANGNLAQRIGVGAVSAVTSGGVTGFVFDSIGSVIQNYSTGEDTSLGNTLSVALQGGVKGAANFATMSLAGVPLGQLGRNIGLKAGGGSFWGNTGRVTAKLGLESGKTYMEGMGMYLGGYVAGKIEGATDANGNPIEFDLWGGTLESLPTAVGFRLQHAISGLKGGRKDAQGNDVGWLRSTCMNMRDFFTSDKAKSAAFAMTEDERNQVMDSYHKAQGFQRYSFDNVVTAALDGKKKRKYDNYYLSDDKYSEPETQLGDVESDVETVRTVYDKVMADPNVSWDAKAKFSAMVTGIMPSARPMVDSVRFSSDAEHKYMCEYSKDGELLSRVKYDNANQRDALLFKTRMTRENLRMKNAVAGLLLGDKNNYDLQNAFYKAKLNEGLTQEKIIEGMKDPESEIGKEFSRYAFENGRFREIGETAARICDMPFEIFMSEYIKDPMKRSEEGQKACTKFRQLVESYLFPEGKVHEEQSNLDGKDVADENGLGSEKPNGESVKAELSNLSEAEKEMDELINTNDVFGQNFSDLQKQGMTNPQIYAWMVENGMTEEQLAPFAHYINANARVQGMQEATQQKIEENVSRYVQDWSLHGTLNGEEMNGGQAVWVQDSDGRTLVVGSGEMAFDSTTGRAKDGVGDMLVCFDPNKGEMVYVKAEDVTFFQAQELDAFGNEYRQRLQIINSRAYNEAAVEQAAKNTTELPVEDKPKEEAPAEKEGKEVHTDGHPYVPKVEGKEFVDLSEPKVGDTPKAETPTVKDGETEPQTEPPVEDKPKEEASAMAFEDGTTVPMTTDKKGRPTPDYANMTSEQAAEILDKQLGVNAEPYVDAQIKAAQKAVKDAEKMKIDYNGEPNDIIEQQTVKDQTINAAHAQLEHAENTKKALTARKVKNTIEQGKEETQTEQDTKAQTEAEKRFADAPKVEGRRGTITLPNGEKIKGHYVAVPATALIPSHDPFNGYKPHEGVPLDENGRTINDRDYQSDRAAQDFTETMAADYGGQAMQDIPVVNPDGRVISGNGRTIAGQIAAAKGTDGKYVEARNENAEGFGMKAEDLDKLDHARVVFIPDEPLPYDTATFAKFNKNEKKTQSNTEQAVAKSKTLTSDEVGSIIAEIEGNGSLENFFKNSKAINDLVKTLVKKGIIGQNEIAELMEGNERLSAQGREFVKNLLLGSVFTPETIRMLGFDGEIKNKAIAGIRSIMENMKLGDYSLRDEIDQAIQLLYEAKRDGSKVDTLLRTPEMFDENSADRYPSISQMMALALEGKVADFRDLLDEYNRIAAARNTGEGELFGDRPTKDELVNEFLKYKEWQDYGTRHKETEGSNDVSGTKESEREASGGDGTGNEGEGRAVKGGTIHNPVVQEHDWGQYKPGETFDYEGYKSRFVTLEKDEKGYVEGVVVQHLDDKGNPIEGGRESVPPLMFMLHYKKVGSDKDNLTPAKLSGYGTVRDEQADVSNLPKDLAYRETDVNELQDILENGGMRALPEGKEVEGAKRTVKSKNGRSFSIGKTHGNSHGGKGFSKGAPWSTMGGTLTRGTATKVIIGVKGDATDWQQGHHGSYSEPKSFAEIEHGKPLFVRFDEDGNVAGIGLEQMRFWVSDAEGNFHEFVPTAERKLPILPKETTPETPIEKAAQDYRKDHPLTETEISEVEGLDEEAKATAIDYLYGEDDSEIARICYEQAYNNHNSRLVEEHKAQVSNADMPVRTSTRDSVYGEKPQKKRATKKTKPTDKTVKEKKADAKKFREERDKETADLMQQFLAAGKKKTNENGKALSLVVPIPSTALKWMERNLSLTDEQKALLPKLLTAIKGSMYARIKEGVYNLEDVIENVRNDFKAFFGVISEEDANKILAEAAYKGRYTDPDTGIRMGLAEYAERERKNTPEHKHGLVGDSKSAEEKKANEDAFIERINTSLVNEEKISGIVELRKMAEECGLKDIKDTDLQELVETAIVNRARGIASTATMSDAKKFEAIKKLYENQPSLNQRDSERVMKQQYSTPAPYAFLADMYVKGNGKKITSALEPSAGNGMLTIGLPKDAVHVNDIDAERLANLRRQGFKNITSQDGTQPFTDTVDVVVTNPPFGSATPQDYDGYRISSLEGQMAINALESLKDDGRAAIIIGGKTEYASNGSLKPKDKAFLGYLYSHYNVEDVINVDGSLYAKQGTTYPTRIILINGRRYDENVYPPVKSKARAEAVKDYDELYKRISDDILQSKRMDSSIGSRAGEAQPKHDKQGAANTPEEGLRVRQSGGSEHQPTDGLGRVPTEPTVRTSDNKLGDRRGTKPATDGEVRGGDTGADTTRSKPSEGERRGAVASGNGDGGSVRQQGGLGRANAQSNADEPAAVLKPKQEQKRELSSEKVSYTPKSENPFTLQAVMPADQQEAVDKNLKELGDADQFLVDELGYNDKDDLYAHLAAEQIDSVALALQQAKKGNAFIIGDMTGIGKGRQAASLIRYARKQGQTPVYFTKTAGLLSDVYRDLVDIGSPDLKPFVFGSDKEANITDSDGNIVYKLPSKQETQRVLAYINEHGELPKEYDYVLTTYSQVSSGVYEFDENGNRKERKLAKGKKFQASHYSGQTRRDAIEKLLDNGYLILDESHTAGGQSGQGNYFQHIIQKAKNVTFFSATFAKRPDNMPIYALRTAMNQGGLKASELIDAVRRGGATLQEIMSETLTRCGQMVRRERDMTGVTIDWKTIDDPAVVEEQRAQYDKIIELFNDIITFQKAYVTPYVNGRNEELAEIQSSMGLTRGTESLGIANVPFASKAFNTVQQVLLSLKAKEAAKYAIDYLNQGIKPVIALNNTNESQSGEIQEDVEMEEPDLGISLKKGLAGTLRYTQKGAKNESDSGIINLSDLGEDAANAYNALMQKIEESSTGLSLSPIDVVKNELQKAGYKVGELTGRQTEFIHNENGSVTKTRRTDTDKKKLAREFNDGGLDALILNSSASTGISLHASSKFKDQRKRIMIVVQQQLDINGEVQMRGRIDRTGQVTRGAYVYIVSQIPAEQRLLMMFKAKLKSLDANTTSSQKSKFNEMDVADITNKYGDKVVKVYMAEHLDLYARMADPFGWEKSYGADLSSVDPMKLVSSKGPDRNGGSEDGADASKLLGRMALLKVVEQETMLKDITELYTSEIQRLNEMGENDLEITELPLKARTISKEVWKEGSEPGGDNAFADNTYIEKVNMAILKKPMKAEEVKKAQDGLLGGKTWEGYKEEKKAAVKTYFDEKIAEETKKYEERAVKLATKAKEKYLKEGKKGQKDSGMTDEQIEKMAGFQYEHVYNQEKEKLNDVIRNLNSKASMFERVLDTFSTDETFVLPVDMNNPNELSGFGNSYGRLIDIKITDNFSPNTSNVSFATLDGRRKITFPITGKVGSGEGKADIISAIFRMTRQAAGSGDKQLRVLGMEYGNWDRLVSNESRKDGYIITGNLIQAIIDSKAQGVGGHLVKYTTDTGEIKTGILMSDRFKPTDVSTEYPISSVEEKFGKPTYSGGISEITSSDGDIKIQRRESYWQGPKYELRVPKSKAKGGRYFLDKELMEMMNGKNFETRGNSMLGEFAPEQLHSVLQRLTNLGVKVREKKEAPNNGTHFRDLEAPVEIAEASPVVAKHVDEVSKKVGSKVNIVNSVEEVSDKEAKRKIEAGENVTGWYDENTGEVYIYMPNVHDRYTAEKTIWHETVGHKGMRGLMGENYYTFLRDVWYDLDKPENAKLKELVDEELKRNPLDVYNAVEEGIARLAEDGKGEPGFWNGIKNKVADLLHEIGYRISPNTKDVKYLLWLSKNKQKNPNNPFFRMRAEAVRFRLEHEDVPDMIERDGMFYGNDGRAYKDMSEMSKMDYQETTDGKIHFRTTPSGATAIDRYHRALNAHGYMATESFMDNMLSLQALMKAVDTSIKKIEDVKSSENPYMLQNTMQGAMSNASQMFERNVMKPLDKAMGQLLGAFDGKKDEDKIRNFNLYMIAKHGLERNRVFFVRDHIRALRADEKTKNDADILQRQWDAEKKDLGDRLRNGGITLKDYYEEMDEWIRNNVDKDYDAGEHDYSGMHGLQEIDDLKKPYNDADVIQSVMDSEAKMESLKKGSVKDFWGKVHAATSYSLYCDYANGFQSRETYTKTSQMFDWYIPLRKFDEDTAEDVYGYVTENGDPSSYLGSVVMGAKGRKSLSEVNVLAQIGAMGNMAISNGGKNAIKQAFMRFARSHDSEGLITEGQVWLKKDGTNADGSDRWVEVYPQIPDGAAPKTVSNIISQFEADMKVLQATGDAKVMHNAADIGYKFERAKDKSQHVVDVKVNGKTYRFYINGNPRAAQALNGMLENKGSKVFKPLATITRTMAQLCTSWSPEFVIRNIVRDMQFASSNLAAKEGAKYAGLWGAYYAKMLPIGTGNIKLKDFSGSEGLGLYAKYRNGTLDMSKKIHKYFKEFMENGGETGWVQVLNMKEWEKKYKKDIKAERSKTNKAGKVIRDFLFGNLENMNEVAENMARFATYCASRDFGRSAVRSAYDAKEVSTNFNRHGSGDAVWSFKNGEMGGAKKLRRNTYGFLASYLRQCSMFFNAGIQSTNLLVKNFKNAPKGTLTAMASMPFALGLLVPLLNNWLISDEDEKDRGGVKDPYAEMPDYVRRNSLCIYKGGGTFITIPMAIEIRAFYGLGDLVAGMTLSPNIKTTREAWADAVGCVSQLVPVMDYTNSHKVDKEPLNETIKAISPSALSPFIEWGFNSDWKGSPIRRETTQYNKNAPAWQRAYKSTPKLLMDINKKVNALTNDVAPGNEDMLGNGFLDAITNPAGVNHFLGGFGGGAATFATRAAKLVTSDELEANDVPFLRSFVYKPNEQSSMQRTKSKWYDYVEKMDKTMSNVGRLKSKNVPLDKRLENIGYYYKFSNSKDAEKMQVIQQAERQMKRLKKLRDRASDPAAIDNANKSIDIIMQNAVEQLDRLD